MLKRLAFVSVFSLFLLGLNAQVAKYSNEFLAIGVGARAQGMGNAFIANADDVTAGYWNPAGLTSMNTDIQIGLMHSEYFAGVAKYDYLSFAKKLDTVSTIGVSLIRFGIDDIPNTLDLYDDDGNINYDRITKFSAADYALMFHYARKLGIPGLSIGGNVKVIFRQIGPFAKAYGFGIDAGVQYIKGRWRFGGVLRDATSTFNAWTFNVTDNMQEVFEATGNELPENSLEITLPRLLLGASRYFPIGEKFSAMVEADLDMTFDGKRNTLIKSSFASIDPRLGVEFAYKDFVYLRGGIGNFQKETDFGDQTRLTFQPNFGVGIIIKKIVAIDYALTDIGNTSIALYSNIFSVRINLGNKIPN
jgi:hypothetical protein